MSSAEKMPHCIILGVGICFIVAAQSAAVLNWTLNTTALPGVSNSTLNTTTLPGVSNSTLNLTSASSIQQDDSFALALTGSSEDDSSTSSTTISITVSISIPCVLLFICCFWLVYKKVG